MHEHDIHVPTEAGRYIHTGTAIAGMTENIMLIDPKRVEKRAH